jgi:Fungal Zn(2)-Cys(6) binuclear cluster domain
MDPYNAQNLLGPKDEAATPPSGSKLQLQSSGPSSASVSAVVSTSHLTIPAPPATRIRRRNRMITSCLECRRRKLKCDKSHPCSNCTKATRTCTFLAPALDQASQLKLTEIKEKVGSLERLLERDVARPTISSHTERALPDDTDDDLPGAEDEKDLEPSPLAVGDAVYDDDAGNADDDMLDLGIQIGKMRITERIGGFFRPKISQEVSVHFCNAGLLPNPLKRLYFPTYPDNYASTVYSYSLIV